jgi:zinc transporter ZupT
VLTVHSALDGAALALLARTGAVGLAPVFLSLPVALHRVPEGMLLAAALLPRAGARWTIAIAGVVGGTAVGGGIVGRAILDAVGTAALQAIVAAGVGILMSALTYRGHHDHHDGAHTHA